MFIRLIFVRSDLAYEFPRQKPWDNAGSRIESAPWCVRTKVIDNETSGCRGAMPKGASQSRAILTVTAPNVTYLRRLVGLVRQGHVLMINYIDKCHFARPIE